MYTIESNIASTIINKLDRKYISNPIIIKDIDNNEIIGQDKLSFYDANYYFLDNGDIYKYENTLKAKVPHFSEIFQYIYSGNKTITVPEVGGEKTYKLELVREDFIERASSSMRFCYIYKADIVINNSEEYTLFFNNLYGINGAVENLGTVFTTKNGEVISATVAKDESENYIFKIKRIM